MVHFPDPGTVGGGVLWQGTVAQARAQTIKKSKEVRGPSMTKTARNMPQKSQYRHVPCALRGDGVCIRGDNVSAGQRGTVEEGRVSVSAP